MNDSINASTKGRYISLCTKTTMAFLPHSYPLIMLDRLKACYPDEGVAISVKHITMTDPVLSGHFPGFPIYPGALIIEAMAQNAGMAMALREIYQSVGSLEGMLDQFHRSARVIPGERKLYALVENRIKFTQPVFPGCALELEARLQLARDGMHVFQVSARVEGVEMARGQLTMAEVPWNMAMNVMDKIGNA